METEQDVIEQLKTENDDFNDQVYQLKELNDQYIEQNAVLVDQV
jgi:hypothetical protein